LQHGEIGGPVLGVGELRRCALGVPVGERGAAVVVHAGSDPAVGVPVLEPVPVQRLAEGGVGGARDEQRVPGGERVVEVARERALLGGDEAADLGVALKEDHRPAGPRQLGGGDHAVDATSDDDRIGLVRHLADSSQGDYMGTALQNFWHAGYPAEKTFKIGELISARRELASGTIVSSIVHKEDVHCNKHSPNAVNWIIYGSNSVFREP
jgi:hypothetical protein